MNLKTSRDRIEDCIQLAKAIIKAHDLEDFMLLDIARMIQKESIEQERNEIIRAAFVVSKNDSYPSALEKIASAIDGRL